MNDAAKLFDKLVKLPFQEVFKEVDTMTRYDIRCDDGDGLLSVVLSLDGDMHAAIDEAPNRRELYHYGPVSFRARTFIGGGRNERVRQALLLLALAIKADSESK